MKSHIAKTCWCALLFFLLAPLADAQTIVLQQKFIAKYHNRATLEGNFIVDHAHPQPNPPAQDGDLHAAGRSDAVGLPMVSEVMNAAGATQQAIVNAIHANEGTGKAVPIAGAWRIWFEHPSKAPQVQGATVPPAANTNPNHCFEIHPITEYAGQAVPDSLQPINGYTRKTPTLRSANTKNSQRPFKSPRIPLPSLRNKWATTTSSSPRNLRASRTTSTRTTKANRMARPFSPISSAPRATTFSSTISA